MLMLKTLHVGLVLLSIGLFSFRFVARQRQAAIMQRRWMRIAPHLIDTLLLASGLWLAISLRLSPLAAPWFAIKLVLIIGYILMGILAFRARSPRRAWLRATLALGLALGAVSMAVLKPF